ncbi:DUF7507 domain-containing protein, partial [Actibacterium lipolyticum]|uniref:DUF7507 domain-containing protein n=1 Tax=Actibacterium lipolyticum TaxID=1524263 RepID=UPI003F96466E
TVTPLAPAPAVSMELVDDTTALSTPVAEGDVVTYTYTVTNDGNVTLALDTIAPITPTLTDADGTALTLTTAPAFEGPASSLGSAEGTLLPGEVATYTATYTLTQSDIDAGGISQTATVDGTDPNATVVSGTSDDPADLTGAADATVTPLAPAPAVSMELVDDTTALSTPVAEGDVVTYTYTVTNDGNVTLDGVAISPTLTDADGNVLTLTTGPDFGTATSGSAEGTLLPGEVATYTATYILEQSDIDAGGVSQTAEVDATDPTGAPSNAVSDDPADATGSDDATVTPLAPAPAVSMELVADTSALGTPVVAGEEITYTYTVSNNGNVTLDGVVISPTLTDADGNVLTLTTGPDFGTATSGSAEGTLLPGEVATYTATYILEQSDIDAGGVSQTAEVDATDPTGAPSNAVSDDPADATGSDDATVTPLAPAPAVSMELVADTSALGTPVVAGEEITYTYTVSNNGNVTLDGVAISPTLTDADGNVLTL